MAQKYNPLLKFGFQETGGGGEAEQIAALQEAVSVLQEQAATLQTELNTLKGNKITKCFSESDFAALEQNEIFEWQGETGNGLQNGFFYKITSAQTTIEPGVKYYQVVNDITIGGITIKANDYYLVNDLPTGYIDNRFYAQFPSSGNYFAYTLQSNSYKPVVNDIVFDNANNTFLTVESVSGDEMTLSNGATVTFNPFAYQNPTNVINCVALDGTSIVVAPKILNATNKLPIVAVYDGAFVPIVLEPYTEWKLLTTSSEITIPAQFARANTELQQLSLVNNQVKYTLSDGETVVNMVSEDSISGTPVNFPSAAVSGNIASGDTLGVMLKKVSQYFYYAEISITPQTGDTHEDGFKALISNLTSLLPSLKKASSFRILFTFFNKCIVEGGAYSTDSYPNVDGHYYFCNFIAYRILGQANVIYQFGWDNTTWYFRTI